MVAFVLSSLIGIVGIVVPMMYGIRSREIGARLTWGEAMAAGTYVFFIMFWWYGVIPHQWLAWADNELNWRPDRVLFGVGNILRPEASGGWLPFTMNWQHLRDLIAVAIYGVGLGLNIALWAVWSDRKKKADAKAAIQPTSTYGRPLVKQG